MPLRQSQSGNCSAYFPWSSQNREGACPTLGQSLGRCRPRGCVLNSEVPPTRSLRNKVQWFPNATVHCAGAVPCTSWLAQCSSIGQAGLRLRTHSDWELYAVVLIRTSALRYGCLQGSSGAETGFCAYTALREPPGSLPAGSLSQLRTAARGQGGVGECRARLPGRLPLIARS